MKAKNSILVLILIYFLLSAICFKTFSQEYGVFNYHPGVQFYLGKTFFINDLDKPAQVPINLTQQVVKPWGTAAQSATIKQRLVLGRQHLSKALGIDAKIDAKVLIYKASASFNYSWQESSNDESLFIVCEANALYGPETFSDYSINTSLQNLFKNDKLLFNETYGDRIIYEQTKGNKVDVVIELNSVSAETKAKIVAAAGAGGGAGIYEVTGNTTFSKAVQSTESYISRNIEVYSTGGDGIAPFSNLVSSKLNSETYFDDINSALGDLLRSFNYNNAIPVIVKYNSLNKQLNLDPRSIMEIDPMPSYKIETIVSSYRKYYSLLSTGQELLESMDDSDVQNKTKYRNLVSTRLDTLSSVLKRIKANYNDCLKNSDCTIKSVVFANGIIPSNSSATIFGQKRVRENVFPADDPFSQPIIYSELSSIYFFWEGLNSIKISIGNDVVIDYSTPSAFHYFGYDDAQNNELITGIDSFVSQSAAGMDDVWVTFTNTIGMSTKKRIGRIFWSKEKPFGTHGRIFEIQCRRLVSDIKMKDGEEFYENYSSLIRD